jgi:hypothetical protein
MLPGAVGAEFTVTANVWNNEDPQELLAVIVILPLVEPETVLILVAAEVPVQPKGKLQVYDVAPATGEIV